MFPVFLSCEVALGQMRKIGIHFIIYHGKWNGTWLAEDGPCLWLEQLAELMAQIVTHLLQMAIDAIRMLNCQQLVIRLAKHSFGKLQIIQGHPYGSNSIPNKQIQIRNFGHKK